MLIQEHVWVFGKCLVCGAQQADNYVSGNDLRSCLWRDNYSYGKLRPEPKRRLSVCDDTEEISRRIAELRKEREQLLEQNDGGHE